MSPTVDEIKKEKEGNDIEFLETAMEFYYEDLNTARNVENENQKDVFEAAKNANEVTIADEKNFY